MSIVPRLLELYAEGGRRQCPGERVSQTDHALQTAYRAREAQAPPWLVVAALLHDVAHLLPGPRTRKVAAGRRHARLSAAFLAPHFTPEVPAVVALHVTAKRYLCAVDPGYLEVLSPASIRSLPHQGGLLSPEECLAFEAHPYHAEAVLLRRWGDRARVPGLAVPGLGAYVSLLEAAERTR
jgi:gamma-butyrobetaine dioxygenase